MLIPKAFHGLLYAWLYLSKFLSSRQGILPWPLLYISPGSSHPIFLSLLAGSAHTVRPLYLDKVHNYKWPQPYTFHINVYNCTKVIYLNKIWLSDPFCGISGVLILKASFCGLLSASLYLSRLLSTRKNPPMTPLLHVPWSLSPPSSSTSRKCPLHYALSYEQSRYTFLSDYNHVPRTSIYIIVQESFIWVRSNFQTSFVV